jgi:hypothetical protein
MEAKEIELTQDELKEWLDQHETKRDRFPCQVELYALRGVDVHASNVLSYVNSEGARQAFQIIKSDILAQTRRLDSRATGAELFLLMNNAVEKGYRFEFEVR